ncbi:MAG: hypothetical protein B6247_03280 [Candidatus Parabeggiatoa sp. nov. 2]|nr:MAG: hypothetical protein B6247_03280 [Beggiatoa sp. 4572_84]
MGRRRHPMNLVNFLQELSAQKIELFVEDERLRYRAPKGVLTPSLLSKITQYKSEIIALLKAPKVYPLSSGQRALWFLYQLAPESPAYNIMYAARCRSDLEIQTLRKAFEVLMQRHSILRTTYTTNNEGNPIQQVHHNPDVPVNVIDASEWCQEDFNQWLATEADRPFNLEQGPVVRLSLVTHLYDTTALLLTVHHIATDLLSLEILIKELQLLYQAFKSNRPNPLPSLKWHYQNYVHWETSMLAGSTGEKLWNYWQNKLSDELPVLNLPTDHPRPPVQTYRGATYGFSLTNKMAGKMADQIRQLCEESHNTPYMFFLAVFQVLLYRYTGQEDILMGSPMAGRNRRELTEIVGYFVNQVVLRAELHGNPTFKELLQRVHHHVLETLDYQDYPFGQLVERLQVKREPSRSPVFQVAFVWDKLYSSKNSTETTHSEELILEPFAFEQRGSDFDLTLTIFEKERSFSGLWNYNTDLFEKATITRMAGHFKTLLEGIIANPVGRLSQLPLLTEAEQQQLIAWNQTEMDYPRDKTIVDLFQAQVEKTPEKIAVVFEDQQLTYLELNAKTNQLAHYLMRLGVSTETLVGICVERSLEMLIGLLGVMKAGGAYMPLDPNYITSRLQFMLTESQVPVLLTQSLMLEKLPVGEASVVCLDSEWEQIATYSDENPVRLRSPSHLAYVIYTSGSTGVPKGVMIEHQGMLNHLYAKIADLNLTKTDIVAQNASQTFDISIWQFLAILLMGGRVHIVNDETAADPVLLLKQVVQQRITVLEIVPSLLQMILEEVTLRAETRPNLSQLRWLILTGEALPPQLCLKWLAAYPAIPLLNAYGPTECSDDVSHYRIEKSPGLEVSNTPIGKPVNNMRLYILDAGWQPVPIGVVGELYVGGVGVGRGYLKNPQKTAEVFMPALFELEPGARLYKTGDLARYLPDGNIEYLGRVDNQVKLRGFRIELGEIEATLLQHKTVKEAVVVLYDKENNPRLVAYIVSDQLSVVSDHIVSDQLSVISDQVNNEASGQISPITADNGSLITELRAWLKSRLPEYMIPAHLTVLDKLPLMPNGKIDRQALPAPELAVEVDSVAPRTETEQLLCLLWSQVLGVEVTHLNTHFFEAGGHSLLATQLVSRIRERFQLEMPLKVVFERPTVQEQAQWLAQQQRQTELPNITPLGKGEPQVLSFAQQRLWFLAQLEGPSATYNMPAALTIQGELNLSALQQTFIHLIERHLNLRLCFPEVDGQAVVQVLPVYNPISIIDLSQLSDTEQPSQVERLRRAHAMAPFNLTTGPLLRVQLLKLSAKTHWLLVNMQHIISDGWSLGILIRGWRTLYTAYCHNQKADTSALPIQYPDYAAWQRHWLTGDILERQQAYWKNKLAGSPELLELPVDYPRPAVMSYQGAHWQTTLPADLTLKLKQLSQQQEVTLYMMLLTAFSILLSRYSGQPDILVGCPIANRTHYQTEELIGFFVNTLVLRTQIQGEQTVSELLKQVRQTALEAYAHQDIPFEVLVEQLNPARHLSHSPLFQVMFVLQNVPTESLDLTELKVSLVESESTIAKFDLTLSIEEHDDILVCDWEYATDLFRSDTLKHLSEHFQVLLEGVVHNVAQSVSQLPLLTEADQQQLIAWNQTQTDYPLEEKTIVDLFQEQVDKTPSNLAVVFEGQSLTYHELNFKANQLAHYLIEQRVQAETLVGICVERSLEMVIGLLGILKAGGAYVPLDPDYPAPRLQFMLEDSQIPILLTQTHLIERLPAPRALVVALDSEWATIAAYFAENRVRQKTGHEHLAYMIYTSGSTGKPKGVMIEHRAIAQHIHNSIQSYQIQPSDHILQFASLNFDASIEQIFSAWCGGARLVLLSTNRLPTGELSILIEKESLTIVDLPPAYWQQLLTEEAQTPSLASLKLLILGGEVLSSQLAYQTRQTLSNQTRVLNAYGPTEATITATLFEITEPSSELITSATSANTPIGQPLLGTQIYILDAYHNLTPLGVPGELCIAGVGLARGYLNQPDLTAEKFIKIELFGKQKRIYKTGDLARWREDGNLEYLGRLDHQVKLRGFRIELGEIEATLTQHEAVTEAVVVFIKDEGNPRLAAYLTLATPTDDIAQVLRTWLKARLPDYMIPAHVMVLEKLPLTPNGKIDRNALPAPDLAATTKHSQAPRTDTEQRLVEVWQHVLKQTDIGIQDNFFERGGDSILSIQIVARARAVDLELSPRDIFQHQTIAELAQVVRTGTTLVAEQGLVTGQVPLIPIQRAFFAHQPAEPWHFNQAVLLAVPKHLNDVALQKALAAILEHHDALRLRYHQVDGDWQQWQTMPSDELPFHQEDLSHLEGQAQTQALKERVDFWQASLNLETGPLVRLVFFQLGTQARLLWCIHHLAVDGVSWRILLEDLQTAYHQALADEPIRLPNKTSAFKVWAEHLTQWAESDALAAQTNDWHHLPMVNPLPIDNPNGRNRMADTQHYTIRLSAETTQRLLTETPAAYRTQISDVLLTALMLTLQAWTGQKQQLIDLESHGRAELFNEIDLSRTVGWFTSLYTWPLTLPMETDLGHALKAIKEQLRQIPDEGVGYGVLRYLCEEKLPQGQILFNYLGQFDQSLSENDWDFATEDSGLSHSLRGEREHLIEINGQTANGCLSLTWSYSGEQYQAQTIQQWADNYQQQLQHLIEHCAAHYGYSPSDFPLAALSQNKLDQIVHAYNNNIADIYPLSPMQQGMLFHTLYAPESGIYFEQLHCGLVGALNVTAFRQAWQALVDQHPILRTAFWHQGEQLQQLVYKQAQLRWQEFDWRDRSAEQRTQELQTILTLERQQGFELTGAPLMRVQLIRETDQKYRLVWHFHHLLLDGWCLPILFTELFEAYQAFCNQRQPSLPSSRPYRDYIHWLSQQDFQAAKSYWQAQLHGFYMVGRRTTNDQPADYQKQSLRLEAELTGQLERFSRQHRLTVNTLVQGAWACLLSRYSGETDVVFGVTTSGRQIPLWGCDRMLGLFLNTLPLRVQVDRSDLIDWLLSIQHRQQQNDQYAYTPLVDILGSSDVPGGVALFETIVVFEYQVDDRLKDDSFKHAESVSITEVQGIEYTNYPITLAVIPGPRLHFKLTYDAKRFSSTSIERMLAHLSRLLSGMVNHPNSALHQLPLLTPAEQQQLIAWNQTQTDYPLDKTIVDLFQEQVDKTPSNVAVVFEGQKLTYQALNFKANQLAHYLIEKGVSAETLVGICMERSLEILISFLGVLKAGGAYLPLAPNSLAPRLHFMLTESKVPVLLTQSLLLEKLPVVEANVVCLDSDWEQIAAYSDENPERRCSPDNLAYVIYTSGSTGVPKGVMVEHQGMLNHLYAKIDEIKLTKTDIVAQNASQTFDISVWQFLAILLMGGRVHIVNDETAADPVLLLKQVVQQRITVLEIVPSLLQMILEEITLQAETRPNLSQLRWLILTGEALPPQLCLKWLAAYPAIPLLNAYGPTECSDDVSHYRLENSPGLEVSNIPIGKPVNNMRLYVLDASGQLVPIGVVGELYVGGVGVGRGYLKNSPKTAEVFVPDRFSQESGARLYKTGDLARWREDGNLEYLGRIDHQIKLRGFRIELGEIEATLTQHEAVTEAVVVLIRDEGNPRLAAYITLATPTDYIAQVLRTWLKARLPDYMMPAHIMSLEQLPLTPNGKIDRNALPAPDLAQPDVLKEPQSEVERLLSQIWSQVLGYEISNTKADFFEAGGHSLLATQLVSRIRERFAVEMPLKKVFEHALLQEQAQWLAHQQRGISLPPLTPLAEGEPLVLSFAQQRLWFLAQLEGPSATYNLPAALRIEGELSQGALQQSFISLIEHHVNLRLCFPEVDGQATVQVLAVYNPYGLIDLSALPLAQQQGLANHIIEAFASAPFELTNGPLMRVQLLKLSTQEHFLLVNMHHIISDGWSISVLVRQWSKLYLAHLQNRAPQLPVLSIQYPDYAAWQRNWLQGELLERQLTYWKEQLAGAPALLELPTDYPRPAVMSYQGAQLQTRLPAEFTARLKSFSQQNGFTLYMTLLAAFHILLSRYSGQADILVGSPIANRTHQQTEDLIGFFVNTLVLRTQVNSKVPVTQLLQQVRQTALQAYAHQDIPFEYLVEQLNPARSLSHSPLFQVMLVLQNAPEEQLELGGLKVSNEDSESTIAKFDLTLSITEHDEVLVCEWEYCTDLFREDTIKRLSEHFQVLLESIVNNPAMSVSQLPLLTQAEQQQLMAWNQTQTDYPVEKTIVDLFQEQVEKTASNIAVVFEGQKLTYHELNRYANQLAHYLIEKGVQADTLVGICVERSLEMVIGLLGILKAGGAYVPLDPDYPAPRLQFMLEDSQVPVLLTQSHLIERLPTHQAKLVGLDREWAMIAAYSGSNPEKQSGPENLAYVIYTSGSTGKPKGVMIEHAALIHFIHSAVKIYPIYEEDSVLQFASINFDTAVEEIYPGLTQGGRLILRDKGMLDTEHTFLQTCQHKAVTILDLPTAYWQQVITAPDSKNNWPESVRLVIIGGEAASLQHVKYWQQTFSQQVQLLNTYGPTEATVVASTYRLTESVSHLPIGKPILGTQIYLLDAHHNPTPIGIPGELCIAGRGLARGYLNRPELTLEKFIELDIFGEQKRLYKTGDLARWREDGNLEYLGRRDHQVKLRGFRIELGEIEATLTQHEAVTEAVVVLFKDNGNPRLAAYITLATPTDDYAKVLRTWLKARLPDYMMPAHIMSLEQLPLTPNGKIDRNALPAPDLAQSDVVVEPQSDFERLLCQIWSEVLGYEISNTKTDFFEAGGHSLLATQLVSRIRERFTVEMPLQKVFEHARLQEQGQWLTHQQRGTPLPPLTPLAEGEPLVLSFAQQRLWFLAQLEGPSATYNMPAALRLSCELSVNALQQSFISLIEHHVNLLPLAQQRVANHLIELEANAPFELTSGPLMRVELLKLSTQEHLLLFNMHHIISDGWSISVLVRQWAELYLAYVQNSVPELPAMSIQYPDYAAWQRNWLQGELLERQLSYWKEQLAGAPALLELPTDYPRPAVLTYEGSYLQTRLPAELTARLKSFSQQNGVTLYMTLLAAFQILLSRYSGQHDILVGSPIANRTSIT